MSWGNLHARPDLSPLFGPLGKDENDRILDWLLQIEDRLRVLADEASRHVGVRYEHLEFGFFAGIAGAEIAGGPTGDAGDIWFEIHNQYDESTNTSHAPPWTVDSRVIVFCVDQQNGYDSCTHTLDGFTTETDTPVATLETLAAHVEKIREALLSRQAAEITKSRHADLPPR